MAMDTIPSALDMAFRTALLLAGNTKTAEAAVMDGIGACEDLSHRGLLIVFCSPNIERRGPVKVKYGHPVQDTHRSSNKRSALESQPHAAINQPAL